MGLLDWLFGGDRRDEVTQPAAALPPIQKIPRVVWRDGSYPMNAVGESHFQDTLERICGPHSRQGHRVETIATLIREPDNPHDPNAVAVEVYGEKVGYLSREEAGRVGGQMAKESLDQVECGAVITGGWRTNQYDEGLFGVRLAIPNWGWIDMGTGREAPVTERRRSVPVNRPQATKGGPLVGQRVMLWGLSDTGPEAAELAGLGAKIMAGVGGSTTMLIHSEDELSPGAIGSATFRKTQERIAAGSEIEIISLRALRARLGLD